MSWSFSVPVILILLTSDSGITVKTDNVLTRALLEISEVNSTKPFDTNTKKVTRGRANATTEELSFSVDDVLDKLTRWSYAPGFVEKKVCRRKCQRAGKPFGRLLATKCQCYCPLNAPDLGLCSATGKCDRFCASLGYHRGGDCVYNAVCFCYCKKKDWYDVNQVYTEEIDPVKRQSAPGNTNTTTMFGSTLEAVLYHIYNHVISWMERD